MGAGFGLGEGRDGRDVIAAPPPYTRASRPQATPPNVAVPMATEGAVPKCSQDGGLKGAASAAPCVLNPWTGGDSEGGLEYWGEKLANCAN